MTVKKLIEVLQQIPDQEKDVYVQCNAAGTYPCRVVMQDEEGDVVISNKKDAEIYFYPTVETKGGDE